MVDIKQIEHDVMYALGYIDSNGIPLVDWIEYSIEDDVYYYKIWDYRKEEYIDDLIYKAHKEALYAAGYR